MHKLLDMHSGTREELITAIQRHWALQVGPSGHSSVWYPAHSPNITQSRAGFCVQSPLMSTACMALPDQAGLYSLDKLCKPF